MSLKALHLVFVSALSALTFGLCAWKVREYLGEHGSQRDLVFGVIAFLAGIGVLVYGWYFLKKLKRFSYL